MPPLVRQHFSFPARKPTVNSATFVALPHFQKLPLSPPTSLQSNAFFTPDPRIKFSFSEAAQTRRDYPRTLGPSASLRPPPSLWRSTDNRRLCPPKNPPLQSKAPPNIITVTLRPP